MDRFIIQNLVVDVLIYLLDKNFPLEEVFMKERIVEIFDKNSILYNDEYIDTILNKVKTIFLTKKHTRSDIRRELANMKFHY